MSQPFGDVSHGRIGQFFIGDPSLVGYFQLATDGADNSGNGHTGTLNSVTFKPGKFGALNSLVGNFDGSTSFVSAATAFNLNDATYMCWVQTSVDTTRIISEYDTVSGNGWVLILEVGAVSAHKAVFALVNFGVGGSTTVASSNSIDDGVPHLLTGVRSGTTYKIYVDGVLSGVTTGGSAQATNTPITIGAEIYGSVAYSPYNGQMAEVAVFNRALPDHQISQYYEWAAKKKKPAWLRIITKGFATTWARTASASVSNGAGRSATVAYTFLHVFVRTAAVTVMNSAARLATASRSFIIKISNVFRWGFSSWD